MLSGISHPETDKKGQSGRGQAAGMERPIEWTFRLQWLGDCVSAASPSDIHHTERHPSRTIPHRSKPTVWPPRYGPERGWVSGAIWWARTFPKVFPRLVSHLEPALFVSPATCSAAPTHINKVLADLTLCWTARKQILFSFLILVIQSKYCFG